MRISSQMLYLWIPFIKTVLLDEQIDTGSQHLYAHLYHEKM